jgi:hypothetical protein
MADQSLAYVIFRFLTGPLIRLHADRICMMHRFRWLPLLLVWTGLLAGADFSGKVVAIADGDTISVLHDGRAERIRLYGIDCPEAKQAFGTRERVWVLRMILSEALVLLVAGLVPGAIALVIAARFVEKMLYGVSAFDPIRLAGITAVLAFVAIVSGLLPALRAASIDPIQALRAE